jgi:hypothetical protein
VDDESFRSRQELDEFASVIPALSELALERLEVGSVLNEGYANRTRIIVGRRVYQHQLCARVVDGAYLVAPRFQPAS